MLPPHRWTMKTPGWCHIVWNSAPVSDLETSKPSKKKVQYITCTLLLRQHEACKASEIHFSVQSFLNLLVWLHYDGRFTQRSRTLIATEIRAQFYGTACCENKQWPCCERCTVCRPTAWKVRTEGSGKRKSDLCIEASAELSSALLLSMKLSVILGESLEPDYSCVAVNYILFIILIAHLSPNWKSIELSALNFHVFESCAFNV